ncbi:I78 family peptidase inhibitor [Paracoccus lutimaris]|uniref:Peptidase inhibitor I78 family protein n=1 Tax=Paracoccus lutimaris TaxID=1490030 RepID=A0A368Z8S2_9RHOB|nr:I78 family peptidase inhibitor [Paracoccus lutimaris]RCW88791.1 peptidase inhibitor I78 family protein [Paracoccus lutimaris]
MKSFMPLILSAPLLLAACADAPGGRDAVLGEEVTNADGTTSVDSCGAAGYAGLVGQTNPTIRVAEGTPYRTYRTGDPVTSDFSLKRLNFEYDRSGKLLRVTCG